MLKVIIAQVKGSTKSIVINIQVCGKDFMGVETREKQLSSLKTNSFYSRTACHRFYYEISYLSLQGTASRIG